MLHFLSCLLQKCGSLEAGVLGRMTLSQRDLLCLVCARFGNKDKGPRKRRHALELGAGVDEISSYALGHVACVKNT